MIRYLRRLSSTARKIEEAALIGAEVAAATPDPARAVRAARTRALMLGLDPAHLRISVSRPTPEGAPARVTLVYGQHRATATKEVQR